MVDFAKTLKNIDLDTVLGTAGLYRRPQGVGIGGFFFGLGVGLLAGSAVSMLLTPYKGDEAREKLLKAGEDLSRTVQTKVGEIQRQMNSNKSIDASSSVTGGYSNTRVGV